MPVQKIGRYEIIGELGKGAMGVVYKAKDPNIGRPVALKTMRVDVLGAEHDDMVRRFQNEARAAGVLNHPNIVTIYDAGEDQGVFYIAMEYIEGITLSALLHEKHTLPAEEVVQIGSQICAGLQYAHFRKVIHRDIKPANIMISGNGGPVKIMDFGIAKAGASLTHTGEVVGTPHYMSPEQVKGQDLDGRSDLFSTGVLLYEMVTGEKPFAGDTVTTIIYKIVHENPLPPREVDVTIPPGLSMLITKCLAKDPEDRYQEGGDLGTALKSYKFISAPEPKPVAPAPPSGLPLNTTRIPAPVTAPIPPRPASGTQPTASTQPVTTMRAATATRQAMSMANAPTVAVPPQKPAEKSQSRSTILLFVALGIVLAATAGVIRAVKHANQSSATAVQTPAEPEPPTVTDNAPPKPVTPDDRISRVTEETSSNPRNTTAAEPPKVPAAIGIGELRVTSNPPGAQVMIDGVGQDYWVTPFNAPPMKSGTHTLVATAPGLPPQTRQIEVVARKKVVIDFQLTGDKAIYNIASSPNGAEILIDGAPTGSRTPAQIPLKAGTHKVVLQLDGFQPVELMTSSAPGEAVNVAPRMQALNSVNISNTAPTESLGVAAMANLHRNAGEAPTGKGFVLVRTRPKGASITVEGVNIAKVTPLRFPIRPGSYQVTIQKPGYQPVTRVIQVEEGKVSEVDELLLPKR